MKHGFIVSLSLNVMFYKPLLYKIMLETHSSSSVSYFYMDLWSFIDDGDQR